MLVVCLFRGLSVSEAVFEAGRSLTEKDNKKKVAECIHFREVECCLC